MCMMTVAYALSKLELVVEIAAIAVALIVLTLDTARRDGLGRAGLPTLAILTFRLPWPTLALVPICGTNLMQKRASTAWALRIAARTMLCYMDDRILPLHDAHPDVAFVVWRMAIAGASDMFFWLGLVLQTNVCT